jgi:hypothetical protein
MMKMVRLCIHLNKKGFFVFNSYLIEIIFLFLSISVYYKMPYLIRASGLRDFPSSVTTSKPIREPLLPRTSSV